MRRLIIGGLVAVGVAITACSQTTSTATNGASAGAASGSDVVSASAGPTTTWFGDQPGVQHLNFKYGPVKILPGQNNIDTKLDNIPKPDVDGWIVGISPNLTRTDGSIPGVDVIHLHHGVWLNLSHQDPTAPGLPERFFASGEEKTVQKMPNGYGYEYKASDKWVLNYMLHNLLPQPDEVFITYDIDFIPADSPLAAGIKPAHPIWMDVQNGSTYPVFDALKGSGKDGLFTYPDDDPNAYAGRTAPGQRRGRNSTGTTVDPATLPKPNQWVVPQDAVIIGTGGHLHPGGLHTDLWVTRDGASAAPGSDAASEVNGDKAHLFKSDAEYFEPAGSVSWDVVLDTTPPDYRVRIKKGDVLSTTATYDVHDASWYESMGIMVTWVAWGDDATTGPGADPFQTKVAVKGLPTHGHLKENDNHGGQPDTKYADLTKAPNGPAADKVNIADFVYAPGDMLNQSTVPVVKPGGTLTFTNNDDKATAVGLWHTITACKAPCNQSTGIAYPLANSDIQFDSGELGTAGPPASGKVDWNIPSNLPDGTYTYFCRIHPFMRGAFRVTDDGGSGSTTASAG